MNYVTGIIAGLLGLLVLVFAIQNLGSVDVSFLFWSTSLPKIVLILGTYLLGMFTGWGLWAVLRKTMAS